MYDDGDASSGTESVGVYGTRTVDGAKVHAQLGMYGNRGGNNNYYSFTNGLNCGGTSGTFSTGIAKTVGWHRMRINVDLNNFIIRTQIDSNAIQNWDTSSCSYKFNKIIGLFIHQQDAAGSYQSVYYDDVVFWDGGFDENPNGVWKDNNTYDVNFTVSANLYSTNVENGSFPATEIGRAHV